MLKEVPIWLKTEYSNDVTLHEHKGEFWVLKRGDKIIASFGDSGLVISCNMYLSSGEILAKEFHSIDQGVEETLELIGEIDPEGTIFGIIGTPCENDTHYFIEPQLVNKES